jgi:hypothetical protein
MGINGTFQKIELHTPWPGMKPEIENYVKHCEICKNKLTKRTKLPLQTTDTSKLVWQNRVLEIVEPLTQTTENNK